MSTLASALFLLSPALHPAVIPSLDRFDDGRVWVFFDDHGLGNDARRADALQDAEDALGERAAQRRRARRTAPGLVDTRDLPLCETYVQRIEDLGATVHVRSRWLNAISVRATLDQARVISTLEFVDRVEPVRRGTRLEAVPVRDARPILAPDDAGFHGLTFDQLDQIGIASLHDLDGLHGQGMVIGVLDTGFELTHDVFNNPDHPIDVLDAWDFVDDDPIVGIEAGDDPDQHAHGTCVLSTIAGYLPGTFVGGAWGASFVLAKTEDITQEVPMEEDQYVAGLEFIEAHGADVATSSLGYIAWYTFDDLDGLTAVTTIAVNIATSNGLVCVTAAGNGGSDGDLPSLIAPADAFEVITCGAVNSLGQTADFSSRGPTADGRVKPEILARGESTACIDPYSTDGYVGASGTSLSTPLIASGAALMLQRHPVWSVGRVRKQLFSTAGDFVMTGTFDPAYIRGYGVANFDAAIRPQIGGRRLP